MSTSASAKDILDHHRAALERMRLVFNEHAFEFDGNEENGDGQHTENVDFKCTNTNLKFLITCCKALVEGSLATFPLLLEPSSSSAPSLTSAHIRPRQIEEVYFSSPPPPPSASLNALSQRVAVLEARADGLERGEELMADSARRIDLLWSAMRIAGGSGGEESSNGHYVRDPQSQYDTNKIHRAASTKQDADGLVSAFADRIAQRVIVGARRLASSTSDEQSSSPPAKNKIEEPPVSAGAAMRAVFETSERLGDLEQVFSRQFKLVEKEIFALRAVAEEDRAKNAATLDDLDALHRERLNAALKSTYEQMDTALEDFVSAEVLDTYVERAASDRLVDLKDIAKRFDDLSFQVKELRTSAERLEQGHNELRNAHDEEVRARGDERAERDALVARVQSVAAREKDKERREEDARKEREHMYAIEREREREEREQELKRLIAKEMEEKEEKLKMEGKEASPPVAPLPPPLPVVIEKPSLNEAQIVSIIDSRVSAALKESFPDAVLLLEDFDTLREAMRAHAARVEMNISDMRADLTDARSQSVTWNGIIAANESLKARVAMIESGHTSWLKASSASQMDHLRAVATSAVKEVVTPVTEALDTLYSVLDLPCRNECAALVKDLSAAQSRERGERLESAIKNGNAEAARGVETSDQNDADASIPIIDAVPAQVAGGSSQALVRTRQEALIKAVHRGLPFRSLVSAIRKLSEGLATCMSMVSEQAEQRKGSGVLRLGYSSGLEYGLVANVDRKGTAPIASDQTSRVESEPSADQQQLTISSKMQRETRSEKNVTSVPSHQSFTDDLALVRARLKSEIGKKQPQQGTTAAVDVRPADTLSSSAAKAIDFSQRTLFKTLMQESSSTREKDQGAIQQGLNFSSEKRVRVTTRQGQNEIWSFY